MEYRTYTAINDIPGNIWDSLVPKSGIGLQYDHLKAVELSGINNIEPQYFIGYNNGAVVGIAYCFIFTMNLAKMTNTYPAYIIETVQKWIPDFMNKKIIEVGHIASLGKTIEVKKEYKKEFINEFKQFIDKLSKSHNADLCIVRDIPEDESTDFDCLTAAGYKKINGFPIAKIPLNWHSLEDYSKSLKSKKRYNFKQNRNKLNSSEVSVRIIEDYAPYAKRLSELWQNVAKKNNGYAHEQLTPAYFENMSKYLGNKSHVVALFINNDIVAYGLNLIGEDEYFGVAEGLDYSYRDKYSLYANNIYEALNVACDKNKTYFNLGITSYDFKTSIGSQLFSCKYYVKCFNNPELTNAYGKLIQEGIIQPKYNHKVFNIETNIKEEHGCDIDKTIDIDIFTKHLNYTRANELKLSGLYSFYPEFKSAQNPAIEYEDRKVIMLGSNSYLGLSTHPKIKEAICKALETYGCGCSGSPLLNGTLDIHKQLECSLSNLVQKEETILYSTGYQANLGALSALVNKSDIVIMDNRNHASLVDGVRLSGAKIVRYKHNDIYSLESKLDKYKDQSKLIVTDSIFSMEGTIVNLPKIVDLKKQYNARLMLDESHAIGVLGKNGGGVATYFHLQHEVDIIMGTFSKSLASVGGFISGKKTLVDSLKHISRAHIFSASLPPTVVAGVLKAIDIIKAEPERRTILLANAKYLANELKNIGYRTEFNGNPIISVDCCHELICLALFNKLFKNGVFVNPVTYPAVPKGKEMLRLSVMATHTKEMLDYTVEVFERLKNSNFPIRRL